MIYVVSNRFLVALTSLLNAIKRILIKGCHNLIENLDQFLFTYLEMFLAEISGFLFDKLPQYLLILEMFIKNL